jgi:AraC-like DNA-binding protein
MDGLAPQAGSALGQTVRQSRRLAFHRMVASRPSLVRVLAGQKRVRWPGGTVSAGPGSLLLLSENLELTVENIPPPGAPYRAALLPIDRTRIEAAYTRLPAGARDRARPVAWDAAPDPAAQDAFDRLFGADGQTFPPSVLALRQEELVLWLAEAGALLAPARPVRLSDRLRALLLARPDADWTADEAARALATSTPTLRRHLAAEETGFTALLQDVRMSQALLLLQTASLPVTEVAAAVGYASPSRFAARFRARFGAAPHEIRRAQAKIDRLGTNLDRYGREGAPQKL